MEKYNDLLNSGRWSNKGTRYAQIQDLVRVTQNLADEANKSSGKYNRE